MAGNPKQSDRIDEVPDRVEHLRKIAKRIKLDHPGICGGRSIAQCGLAGLRISSARPPSDWFGSRAECRRVVQLVGV